MTASRIGEDPRASRAGGSIRSSHALPLILVVALAAAAAAAPAPKSAKPKPQPKQAARAEAEALGPDPKLELEHYARSLSLDEGQRRSALKVFKEKSAVLGEMELKRRAFQSEVAKAQSRIRELNESFQGEFDRMLALEASAKAKLRDLLTPDQQKRFDDMEAERKRYEAEFRRIQDEKTRREKEGGSEPRR